jgi:hypothetical protein
MQQPIKLRGHHLLCLLTYIGKGYTDEFVANFDAIIARMNAGASLHIVTGKDDICAALHVKDRAFCASGEHCLLDMAHQRDGKALAAVGEILKINLRVGSVVTLVKEQYHTLRRSFAEGGIREACIGCEWHGLCTNIAQDKFKNARLMC